MGRSSLVVLACVVLLGGATTVQAALWWSSMATFHVGAGPPPVVFEWGANANSSRHVTDLALSPERTSFSGTFNARAGAEAVVTDVLRIRNTSPKPLDVTLRGDPVPNPRVVALEWHLKNGTEDAALLDHKAASPEASFRLPPGTAFRIDLRDVVASGGGRTDGTTFGVRVTVT